ncbi:lipopolysaccharide biosynthesis protein [Flavobacterium restrictum]|uniref:Membrane protein involved in the export of O-antigen and teichoic acid n=1 Tax=Flavobacterium restrictum TaxID=2594428 RepID=A0A553E364_9FLAO|nr:hypothetical protein [Flavobacterium restrictum]TRX39481.1 hypothetical protein FNW21_09320 [Flavobacterium restrictum]
MNRIQKILFSPSFLVLADQVICSGTNFFLTLVLAQKLDIKNFGLFATLVLLSYLAMSISNALLIQPFQVAIAKITQKKEYQVSLFLGLMALLLLFMLSVKSLVLFLPKTNVYVLQSNAIICYILGFLINDFFRKLFLGLSKIKSAFVMDVLFTALLCIAFVGKQKLQLHEVLWIIGLANMATSLPGILFIVRNYTRPVCWKQFAAAHFAQGKWLFSVALLQWCSSNFFVLVSGIYLGIEALGALRLVQSFFGVINIGLQTVENYYLPKVAQLYADSASKAKKYLLEITTIGAVFFSIILVILFVFSDRIIVLAGGLKYQNYGYVVKIMSVLYFFIFLSYPVRIAIRILVLNKIFFFGYVLSFVSSLATFHFLLRYSGLYGAVSGLIINQIIMILYWQNQLKKNSFQLWK